MEYLACPYSHKDPKVRQERFMAANRAAAKLMSEGRMIFSPISHGHAIAEAGALPIDWAYWEKNCREHLRNCHTFIILMEAGWEASNGLKEEIKIAHELNLVFQYMMPVEFVDNSWIETGK